MPRFFRHRLDLWVVSQRGAVNLDSGRSRVGLFFFSQASTASTFAGEFINRGADRRAGSLGAIYRLGAWSLGGSYSYLTKTDFSADTFATQVRYDF